MDIQDCRKIERALVRGGRRFLQRAFTPAEIKYCQGRAQAAQHFAARFCAKEAFFKALGTGWAKGLRWAEVGVVRNKSGKPSLRLSGRARLMAGRLGAKHLWLSLTHSEQYAAAMVILEG